MEKAYDLKALGEKLKAAGIPVMEDALESAAGKCYIAVKEWLTESAPLSENKIDDIVAPFYGQLDPVILPLIDKINKKVG